MEKYSNDIFKRVKEFKGFKSLDQRFNDDLRNLFENISIDKRDKIYNGIIVFSITCKMEKNLHSFQIPLDLLPIGSKEYEIAVDINRKTLNDFYEFK